jgi:hypothetical protein
VFLVFLAIVLRDRATGGYRVERIERQPAAKAGL